MLTIARFLIQNPPISICLGGGGVQVSWEAVYPSGLTYRNAGISRVTCRISYPYLGSGGRQRGVYRYCDMGFGSGGTSAGIRRRY